MQYSLLLNAKAPNPVWLVCIHTRFPVISDAVSLIEEAISRIVLARDENHLNDDNNNAWKRN